MVDRSDDSPISTDGAEAPFPNSPRVRFFPDGSVSINGLRVIVACMERKHEDDQSVPMWFGPGVRLRPLDLLQTLSGAHDLLLMDYAQNAKVGAGAGNRIQTARGLLDGGR